MAQKLARKSVKRETNKNFNSHRIGWQAETLDQIRMLIERADPEIVEEVKWRKPSNPAGVPVWSRGGMICTGETYKDKIKLTFAKGAALADPAGLFNSGLDGGTRRAIDLLQGDELDAAAFKALIRAAVALNTGGSEAGRASKRSPAPSATPGKSIHKDILAYNAKQAAGERRICEALAQVIDENLAGAESKVWHAHPVWFLDGNPIVGYSKLKDGIRLLFWSGQSFDEAGLAPEGTFKAAEARYTSADQIDAKGLKRWLKKAREIQWDYKNIVKRKGRLEPWK